MVRFVVPAGAPILNGPAVLKTNYPAKDAAFVRDSFQTIPFNYDFVNDAYVEINIKIPGAYEYYVSCEGGDRGESGFLLLEPTLTIKGQHLPSLDAVVLQTIVPKWLGPLPGWRQQMAVVSGLHFNMVHFVPAQARGVSDSPYSLYNQLDLSADLFEGITPAPKTPEERFALLSKELNTMEHEFGILAMTDVVWNHTACNSQWLCEHPESGYNLVNTPHLMPAYELDTALMDFSRDWNTVYKLDHNLKADADLSKALDLFRSKPFMQLKLWEYFALDVATLKEKVMSELFLGDEESDIDRRFDGVATLPLTQRAERLKKYALTEYARMGQRFPHNVDLHACAAYLQSWYIQNLQLTAHKRAAVEEQNAREASSASPIGHVRSIPDITRTDVLSELVSILDEINLPFYKQYDDDVGCIFQALENTVRWQRLNPHGPKLGAVTADTPIVWSYFTRMFDKVGNGQFDPKFVWANNGWIWNANPLIDFAGPKSRAYFRREVIVWGDCVKLRYGKGPQDSPWLWNHMAQYTRLMAKHFHAFRIDNCHSTPIHVAEYLLDEARKVRPNLYVVAELFTGDPAIDRQFVSRLGINSLIREAMQAWDSKELSRVIFRYSGDPVGSFRSSSQAATHCMTHPHAYIDAKESDPHALFMDCTHDNEPPAQKRTVEDSASNAALVTMTCCAMGSVLGYDLCVPNNLDIVHESRRYPPLNLQQGIHPLRRTLNLLNQRMAAENLSEIYVHHEDQYIVVYRQNPVTHRGIVLIARTAFKAAPAAIAGTSIAPCHLSPVVLKKTKCTLLAAQAVEKVETKEQPDPRYISGIPVKLTDQKHLVALTPDASDNTTITIDPMTPPGTIFVFETWLTATEQLSALHELETLQGTRASGIRDLCDKLTLGEVSILMYQSEREEQEHPGRHGAYSIPGHGPFAYCGIAGISAVLRGIMQRNDLGHPLCANLREGAWLMDYVVDRLFRSVDQGRASQNLRAIAVWLRDRFALVKTVPNYLVPKYFSVVLMTVEVAAKDAASAKMGRFIAKSPTFVRNLAMVSLQLHTSVKSASLHPTKEMPSLAAGLPHFATHHMRCWGRDVFISLKGLLMHTSQWEAAANHLVWFGSTMRHGLIPNLLDSGRFPRYNARDAVWWWLQAIQDYTRLAPEGVKFLSTKVPRRFPDGNNFVPHDDPRCFSKESTIAELIVEAMQAHSQGIHFREWNAGPNLDHAMMDRGFNVDAYIDWQQGGIVCGGNPFNCGTWMDKMGDSERAGNKGIPATPRDGAAIELQGLLCSTLDWLDEMHSMGALNVEGVTQPNGKFIKWAEWSCHLREAFDGLFYVPLESEKEGHPNADNIYIQRRGIYCDTVGANDHQGNFQFRPNQYIAMAVAPQLFDPVHARNALELGMAHLAAPLGMRTLDPADPSYRPYYDNANDGTDRMVAHGWNYHCGPEWGWLSGFFYRAYLAFNGGAADDTASVATLERTLQRINTMLIPARIHIYQSAWSGLPELTNKDGETCAGSCTTQAWSAATMIELEHDMLRARERRMHRTLTMEMMTACRLDSS